MRSLIGVAVLAVLSVTARVVPAQDGDPQAPRCLLQLAVELDLDVPNATDPGFLSSLVGNHANFSLVIERVIDDTNVELRLSGPGSTENCLDVVEAMRKDARVENIEVL